MAQHEWHKGMGLMARTYHCPKCGLFMPAPVDTECDESEVVSGDS